MNWDPDDVICAVASAAGGAARGIIRFSGVKSARVVRSVFRPANASVDLDAVQGNVVVDGHLALASLQRRLPAALHFWPTARSYTCQPMAEFHTLGSPPLLEAALAELHRHGARSAAPGEFTLRAFLGGRLDLTQAEAVLGVIDAGRPEQLHAALAQLAGGLAGRIQGLRDRLVDLCAHLEAGLDFAEEDLPFLKQSDLIAQLAGARNGLDGLLAQLTARATQAPVRRVALLGATNAGKSSLFNALVGRAASLVSAESGTTRDYLTAPFALAGGAVELIDTAGQVEAKQSAGKVRPTTSIEQRAHAAADEQASRADVVLLCLDGARPLNAWESEQLAHRDRRRIVIVTKCDLPNGDRSEMLKRCNALRTSSVTGEGLEELKRRVAGALGLTAHRNPDDVSADRQLTRIEAPAPMVDATAARCKDSLSAARASLVRALEAASRPSAEDLVAAEVRLALVELGKVVGAVYTDDILDRVFSRFCIGK